MNRPDYAVYLGLDVGKEEHHATCLDPAGQRVQDKPLPRAEGKIRDLLQTRAQRGRVLVVVDQPASIGARSRSRSFGNWASMRPTCPGS